MFPSPEILLTAPLMHIYFPCVITVIIVSSRLSEFCYRQGQLHSCGRFEIYSSISLTDKCTLKFKALIKLYCPFSTTPPQTHSVSCLVRVGRNIACDNILPQHIMNAKLWFPVATGWRTITERPYGNFIIGFPWPLKLAMDYIAFKLTISGIIQMT